MNEWIRELAQQGKSLQLYGTVGTVANVVSTCYSLYHGKKIGLKFWQALIVVVLIVLFRLELLTDIHQMLRFFQERGILNLKVVVHSIVRSFGFLPLAGWVLAKLLRLKWSLVCDAIVFSPLLTSALAQLGCLFPGCCAGYPCPIGIYSPQEDAICFPVSILETVLTLGIVVYLIVRTRRAGYVSDGTLYPRMLALYGGMRFFCEVLRCEEKFFLGITAVGWHAALLCVIGCLILWRMNKKRPVLAQNEETAL